MAQANILLKKINKLLEARSHPELNKKLPPGEELHNLMTKYFELDKESKYPLYFITFKDENNKDMLTLNTKYSYKTPTGIYTYPIRFAFKKGKIEVPFAGELPYIYVLKRKTDNFIFAREYSKRQCNIDCKKLEDYFVANNTNPEITFFSLVTEANDKAYRIYAEEMYRKEKPIDKMWYLSQVITKSLLGTENISNKWNLILSKVLGYGAIIDTGLGVIHPLEPNQALFFGSRFFIVEDKIDNSSIIIGNKYYNKKNIMIKDEDSIIKGNVEIKDCIINKLPNTLIIKGDLSLINTTINNISNLKVTGRIDFRNSIFNDYPKSINVGEDLDLGSCNITSLPKSTSVGGDLLLLKNQIKELPRTLQIKGEIFVNSKNPLENIPSRIESKIRYINVTNFD